MKITFSSAFKRAFKKVVKGNRALERTYWEKVEIFTHDPFDRRLRTHKLSGSLKDLWSFSITYDVRLIFSFVDKESVVFVDIGGHGAVY